MVFKLFKNLKKSEKGITLIEIVIVIFVIATFSLIVISNFPKILNHYELSSVTYKLAQDLREVEDLGLSGVQIKDNTGEIIKAKGYGLYIDFQYLTNKKYIIYADVDGDQKYSGDSTYPLCSQWSGPTYDCVIKIIDVSQKNADLFIEQVINANIAPYTSINFSPPNPIVKIDNLSVGSSQVGIVLRFKPPAQERRVVWVNTSGLISVQ